MVPQTDVLALRNKIKTWASKANVLVLSGSLPPGVNSSFYRDIIYDVGKNTKVILDSSSSVLEIALEASPYMIKPNLDEFSQIIGKKVEEIDEIIENAVKLIRKYGISVVCVSMGSRGSITVTSEKAYYVPPLTEIEVKGPVGAGDAMVAGFAYALDRGMDLKKAIKIASAVATASLTTEGSQPMDVEVFRQTLPKIQIIEYDL